MKDFLRCDNCLREVNEDAALGWWEMKRVYPLTLHEVKDDYDFCSYECLDKWVDARRPK